MKKVVYIKEMDRRLLTLFNLLDVYFKDGRDSGLLLAVLSVLTYCWCSVSRKLVEHSDFLPVDDVVSAHRVNYVAGDNIVSDDF